nr:alpha-N-arabinofuranosidase [Chloroflexia bacterium]
EFDQVPLLEATATLDVVEEAVTLFAVNRGQDAPLRLEGDLRAFPGYAVVEHLVLEHENPLATNTLEWPREVWPHTRGDAMLREGALNATLPRLSWNVIRLGAATG